MSTLLLALIFAFTLVGSICAGRLMFGFSRHVHREIWAGGICTTLMLACVYRYIQLP